MIKLKGLLKEGTESQLLSLEQLKLKYPQIKFTLKYHSTGLFTGRYFARADINTQDGKLEYLGALKGPVDEHEGLRFLNSIAKSKYDKYY